MSCQHKEIPHLMGGSGDEILRKQVLNNGIPKPSNALNIPVPGKIELNRKDYKSIIDYEKHLKNKDLFSLIPATISASHIKGGMIGGASDDDATDIIKVRRFIPNLHRQINDVCPPIGYPEHTLKVFDPITNHATCAIPPKDGKEQKKGVRFGVVDPANCKEGEEFKITPDGVGVCQPKLDPKKWSRLAPLFSSVDENYNTKFAKHFRTFATLYADAGLSRDDVIKLAEIIRRGDVLAGISRSQGLKDRYEVLKAITDDVNAAYHSLASYGEKIYNLDRADLMTLP